MRYSWTLTVHLHYESEEPKACPASHGVSDRTLGWFRQYDRGRSTLLALVEPKPRVPFQAGIAPNGTKLIGPITFLGHVHRYDLIIP